MVWLMVLRRPPEKKKTLMLTQASSPLHGVKDYCQIWGQEAAWTPQRHWFALEVVARFLLSDISCWSHSQSSSEVIFEEDTLKKIETESLGKTLYLDYVWSFLVWTYPLDHPYSPLVPAMGRKNMWIHGLPDCGVWMIPIQGQPEGWLTGFP